MRKVFCDKCGEEIKGRNVNDVEFKCHFEELLDENRMVSYSDGGGNPISHKLVSFELCNECYNEVMYPAFKAISIGGEVGSTEECVKHNDCSFHRHLDINNIRRL